MKELSIEEKAQRFDEVIEGIQEILSSRQDSIKMSRLQLRLQGILPELKESEDKRIRNFISNELACLRATDEKDSDRYEELTNAITWLEKQGKHQKFRDSIQVGDKVTRNKDGILVNLSQLNRVAKKDNKQGEQKLAWSEEDERLFQIVIDILDRANHLGNISLTDLIACVRKLKSLKDRYTWKPSDLQMKQLGWIAEQNKDNMIGKELMSLHQDLKKLKG